MPRAKTQAADDAVENQTQAADDAVELVRMVRSDEYPEPRTADVHPDEVQNYGAAGWVPAE